MDIERLRDILDAIRSIEKYTSDGRFRFDDDELVRTWCLKHIETIGEAASRVSEALREKYPIAPWRNIIGMRNALVHGYFNVDWDIVWAVVEKELTPLKKYLLEIMSAEGWKP